MLTAYIKKLARSSTPYVFYVEPALINNAFNNNEIPILASNVPRNPPLCFFVGLITKEFSVLRLPLVYYFGYQ